MREGQAPNTSADQLKLVDCEDGPLRGEKPTAFPVAEQEQRGSAGGLVDVQLKSVGRTRARQQRGARLPDDLRLRVALGPVAGLWEQLSGWQQDQPQAAAAAELIRLAGLLMQPEAAPRLLADRLTDRLEETGGDALVESPYAWLIRRGLVQRPACSDERCGDGIRLDTGGDCLSCASVIADRRAVRARIRAEAAAQLAGAGTAELQAALEQRLRRHIVVEADRAQVRHDRAAVVAEERRAAVARRLEREEVAVRGRQSAPCTRCGLPEAAGLCPSCSYARRTELLVAEAVDLVVAVRADLDDPERVADLTARCEADTRALIAEECRRRGGDEAWMAYAAQEVAVPRSRGPARRPGAGRDRR
ncbi:hypothetical protein ACFV4T_37535 [Streptomyces sp. NPDC059755]|uniref:hypothetical protein n=1 Tax=Streptomyces sp. NPDC059755 TaxID=3346934 RepID=UPI003653CEDC